MASKTTSDSQKLVVASIDFGTTYSGWGYSLYSDYKIAPTNANTKVWYSNTGKLLTEKTPTVVLIKPDGKTLEAFGYDAENRYDELNNEEQRGYYYFERFKMELYTSLTQKIDRNFMLKDKRGKSLPALDVFTKAIKYLVDDLLGVIEKTLTGDVLKQSDVHVVITVPAIWTDHAKFFMRAAAEQAGIERHKLSIALEPEAASAYCLHLPMHVSTGQSNISISSLPIGTKYMILDAGGGTVDITVHEVTEKQRVKEVVVASGGGWGGTLADKAFKDLVKDLFGRDVYEQFKKEQKEDRRYLMREFEVTKKTISPENETKKIVMRFPWSLFDIFQKKNSCDFKIKLSNSVKYANDVDFEGDKLKFQPHILKGLFRESCEKVLDHLKNILQNPILKDLDIILMVGGYSESPMLQEVVLNACSSFKIVRPCDASTSILKGALICGRCPEFIRQRMLKYTYGIESTVAFVEGKHPEIRKVKNDHGYRCEKIFHKHVEKNQTVNVGEAQVEQRYVPGFFEQTVIAADIYASELENPEFVDVDCTKIGTFSVGIEKGTIHKGIKVFFTFSGSEIEVAIANETTGEKTKVCVDFLG